jgi:predicted secreted protein
MAVATAIAIYFLIWWIMLFAVLPWGVRAQGEEGAAPGTDPGAPTVPRLRAKLIWTTIAAGVVWVICAVVYAKGLVTLDGLASLFGFPAQNR